MLFAVFINYCLAAQSISESLNLLNRTVNLPFSYRTVPPRFTIILIAGHISFFLGLGLGDGVR